jgi:hypothetical protein
MFAASQFSLIEMPLIEMFADAVVLNDEKAVIGGYSGDWVLKSGR